MKKIIPILIILAAGIAVGIYLQRQPKSQAFEVKAKTDVEQAGADVKTGAQKMDAAAADVKADIRAGVDNTKEIATNVADTVRADAQKVGDVTTNVAGEIKGRLP